MAKRNRPDHDGVFRTQFYRNKRALFIEAGDSAVCGLCGRAINMNLKYPNKWAPTVDHIIPIRLGGHPADRDNLQLVHFHCNAVKGDRLITNQAEFLRMLSGRDAEANDKANAKDMPRTITNRDLPHSIDWKRVQSTPIDVLREEVEENKKRGFVLYANGYREE